LAVLISLLVQDKSLVGLLMEEADFETELAKLLETASKTDLLLNGGKGLRTQADKDMVSNILSWLIMFEIFACRSQSC
jgi:hypothetical protein